MFTHHLRDMIRFIPFFLFFVLFVCGGNSPDATTETPDASTTPTEAPETGISLVEMPATSAFPDAAITKMEYNNGRFDFDATGYEFGVQTPDADQLMCANSAEGQHIHLIINNEPYLAKYEPEFEQELPDGNHYILAFLSRSYHQSIKESAAG